MELKLIEYKEPPSNIINLAAWCIDANNGRKLTDKSFYHSNRLIARKLLADYEQANYAAKELSVIDFTEQYLK